MSMHMHLRVHHGMHACMHACMHLQVHHGMPRPVHACMHACTSGCTTAILRSSSMHARPTGAPDHCSCSSSAVSMKKCGVVHRAISASAASTRDEPTTCREPGPVIRTSHVKPCQAKSHQVTSSHVTSSHVKSRQVTSSHVTSMFKSRPSPSHVQSRQVTPNHAQSHQGSPCGSGRRPRRSPRRARFSGAV